MRKNPTFGARHSGESIIEKKDRVQKFFDAKLKGSVHMTIPEDTSRGIQEYLTGNSVW
ncbi:MAG: hypothetical protein NPIRA06_10300 [Nitrospirales bacterium]|nr:MAG: hypothetical protein NPIRA06_10300 [Nitrospirales bacterium]